MTTERMKRKVWTKAETVLFISCYGGRKDEFDHPRKKKTAYAHVLEDMVFHGFEDTSVTVMSLEGKMRTLLSAYKYAKDNASRTGACPCPAPYMDELDEIFGNKPIKSHAHSLDVGLRTNAVPLPQQNIFDENVIAEKSCLLSTQQKPFSSAVPSPDVAGSSKSSDTRSVSGMKNSYLPSNEKKARKTARERYYEAKLEIKEKKEKTYEKFLERKLEIIREREQRVIEAVEKMLSK